MRIELPDEQRADPLGHLSEHYAPEIVNAGIGFSTAVYQHSTLTTRECEAARMRTAEINGCRLCQNFRATRDLPGYLNAVGGDAWDTVADRGPAPGDEFYHQVSNWRTYDGFSERERLAIEFAEGMGLDPQGLAQNEDFWSRARSAFTDNEIVDLTYAVASWIGLGRAAHVLGLDGACTWMPEPAETADQA
jgi:alkylhydroperoxidase family enzyme